MITIVNLTQHTSTTEQNCVDLTGEDRRMLLAALTFETLPRFTEIQERAAAIASLAADTHHDNAMIGGAPFLMATLERELRARGITPMYAFSVRESAEQVQPDGSTRKVAVFRHAGFVPVTSEI